MNLPNTIRALIATLVLACVSCEVPTDAPSDTQRADRGAALAGEGHAAPPEAASAQDLAPSPGPAGGATSAAEGGGMDIDLSPYEGWESWCMAIEDLPCDPEDLSPCPADRTGRSQICVRPWWARGEQTFVCRPRRLSRAQRKRNRKALEMIVRRLCRPKDGCAPAPLSKFLAVVAMRESALDNQVTHELNPDREANRAALTRALEGGWYEGSPHLSDLSRWTVGYGWYGMNAPLFVSEWDPHAPPEILCRQVESTEVYLRRARRAWKKLSTILPRSEDVRLDNGEVVMVRGVTWYDVHRAVSSGKLGRPDEISSGRFVRRARRAGLDPFASVSLEGLGLEISRDRQNEVAEQIRRSVASALADG